MSEFDTTQVAENDTGTTALTQPTELAWNDDFGEEDVMLAMEQDGVSHSDAVQALREIQVYDKDTNAWRTVTADASGRFPIPPLYSHVPYTVYPDSGIVFLETDDEFSEEDVTLLMEQGGVSRFDAIRALRKDSEKYK